MGHTCPLIGSLNHNSKMKAFEIMQIENIDGKLILTAKAVKNKQSG